MLCYTHCHSKQSAPLSIVCVSKVLSIDTPYLASVHDTITTSILRQNDVATSFWRNKDVIIAVCVRWIARAIYVVSVVFQIGHVFYLGYCRAVCNVSLYWIAVYRESIVIHAFALQRSVYFILTVTIIHLEITPTLVWTHGYRHSHDRRVVFI